MYVAIDRERMIFLWKHSSYKVLTNLAWLGCTNNATCIIPSGSPWAFSDFTVMELQLLIKNSNQVYNAAVPVRSDICAILAAVTDLLPETVVNEWRLEQQAESVNYEDGSYIHSLTSMKPIKALNLYEGMQIGGTVTDFSVSTYKMIYLKIAQRKQAEKDKIEAEARRYKPPAPEKRKRKSKDTEVVDYVKMPPPPPPPPLKALDINKFKKV